MKFVIFNVLLAAFCFHQAEAAFASIFKTAVNAALQGLIKNKNFTLVSDVDLELPTNLSAILGQGYLKLPAITLWGLENTNQTPPLVYAKDYNKSSLMLSIRLDISQMGIDIEYDMDMGLLNAIPLYGTGDINIGLSKVLLNISMNVDVNPKDITDIHFRDVDLLLQMHDTNSYISGFWRNPDVDVIISDIIKLIEKLILMFYAYERECFACVLNPLLEYVLNTVTNQNPSLNIDCDCLLHLFDNQYNLQENLNKLAAVYTTGDKSEFVNLLLSEKMKKFYGEMGGHLYTLMEEEGILKKYNLSLKPNL